ncbi:MAG: S8 family serine peptidase [Actinobacteria bacterium]|nr:S8 family serine peptidase [Actinomycetota bacterium]
MSRETGGTGGQGRSSALWGTGNRGGDSRANALWGKGGRGFAAFMLVLVATAVPLAGAGENQGKPPPAASYIDPYLEGMAITEPNKLVKAIIQSSEGVNDAQNAFGHADRMDSSLDREGLTGSYKFINSVAVTVKAKKISTMAKTPGLTITHDSKVELSGSVLSSKQLWPTASGVRPFWSEEQITTANTPTIAIVDSGIDKNRADFDMGARVIRDVTLTSLPNNSAGDGRGHGTFVAGIAAGSAPDYAGSAPQANVISLDVMDDSGMARTSDVIAAAEWISDNRTEYNIRVVNFSLHSTTPSNFTKDPLDKAVEKLWFSNVVVVVAAGNYGRTDGPSGVPYAPGNDPFVITVGAIDLEGSTNPRKHEAPSWSAYGSTLDGFRKPEISAAGRYMIGPVPANGTLKLAKPDNVVAPTYMRLSGTSFAAPIVAGAAAQILARKPNWTPDQVKGALMQRARFVREEGLTGAAGVGEVNASRSAVVTMPGNPNLALNRFVVPDATGVKAPVFDAASWSDVAKANASWDSASWSDVTWSDASWSSVTWSDVTWSDVTWHDVTWSDALAAADVSFEDNAEGEVAAPTGDYVLTPEGEAAAAADPDLDIPALLEPPAPPALP